MSLVDCAECSQPISDRAKSCPHCGIPLHSLADDLVKGFSGLDAGLLFLPLLGFVGFFLPFFSLSPSSLSSELWFLTESLSTSGWEILKAAWGLFWGLFDSGYPASDLVQLASQLTEHWSDQTAVIIGFIAFVILGPLGFGFFALLEVLFAIPEALDPATRRENAFVQLTFVGVLYALFYSGALYLIARGVAHELSDPKEVWSVFFGMIGTGYYLSVSALVLLLMSKVLRIVNDSLDT